MQHLVYVRFSLLALSSIFFLVDPLAALPTFLAITSGADAARGDVLRGKGSLTALIVLSVFAFTGEGIFHLFGITFPAFELAGGIVLLLIGLDMLEGEALAHAGSCGRHRVPRRRKRTRASCRSCVPMLAGPGSITSVMVLVGQVQNRWQMVAILGSIAFTAAICYLVLGYSDKVVRLLGQTGIRILVRVMGLLLVALAAQYFVNGLADLGVFPHPAE